MINNSIDKHSKIIIREFTVSLLLTYYLKLYHNHSSISTITSYKKEESKRYEGKKQTSISIEKVILYKSRMNS
jgi:hypothetical protein